MHTRGQRSRPCAASRRGSPAAPESARPRRGTGTRTARSTARSTARRRTSSASGPGCRSVTARPARWSSSDLPTPRRALSGCTETCSTWRLPSTGSARGTRRAGPSGHRHPGTPVPPVARENVQGEGLVLGDLGHADVAEGLSGRPLDVPQDRQLVIADRSDAHALDSAAPAPPRGTSRRGDPAARHGGTGRSGRPRAAARAGDSRPGTASAGAADGRRARRHVAIRHADQARW